MSHELLKETLKGRYVGNELSEIHELTCEPIGWEEMKRFKRIPRKIGYFIKKELIAELRRFPLKDDFSRNQYFIRTPAGKFFELTY